MIENKFLHHQALTLLLWSILDSKNKTFSILQK